MANYDGAKVLNAVVSGISIGIDRGFALTIRIFVDYGGSGQSFGGYCLANLSRIQKGEDRYSNLMTIWIAELMRVFEVECFDYIAGKPCRVKIIDGKIVEIGHFLKDSFFSPDKANAMAGLAVEQEVGA